VTIYNSIQRLANYKDHCFGFPQLKQYQNVEVYHISKQYIWRNIVMILSYKFIAEDVQQHKNFNTNC